MKNKQVLFIFIMLLTFIVTPVYAETYLESTGTDVAIRTGPNTTGTTVLKRADKGDRFDLITTDLVKTQGGCESGYWYKIKYNNQEAYICSSYAKVVNTTPIVITAEAKTACENELKAAGFPETYWNSLCTLKAKYPAWKFEAINTGIDFAAAVNGELCKNSISNSSANQSKGFTDGSCNKAYDTGYTGASQTAIAYYMNPLNFLDEKNIFMFESNYKNEALQPYYANAAKNIIPSSTYFVGFIPQIYDYLANATSSGASSTFIAARMKQEIGQGDLGYIAPNDNNRLFSKLSGNYSTRYPATVAKLGNLNNYYNFYSVGAYDGTNVTQRELIYAKNHGWGGTGDKNADRQTAVTGGATWIYNAYTNAGQETVYFHKFNVNPKSSSSTFSHQYMTNISAPVSEAALIYKGYSGAGALSQPIIFHIPVYSNLNAEINNSTQGATGNESNNTNTGLSPSTMVVSSGYALSGTTITNIKKDTGISDIAGRISSQGGTVEIYSNGSRVNDGLIGTGMKVKVSSSAGTTEFTAVVKGDPSGDGKVNALDLLQIQKYILGQKSLDSANKLAGDTSGDGKVNALDLLQVQKNILGQKEL